MSVACPACGTALDDRRELGAFLSESRTIEHVRFECGGCRAVLGREYRIAAGGAAVGREPNGPPSIVFTGASAARALEPLERRARSGDRAGILDELRTLQREDEKPYLGVTEAVQRAVRGIPVRMARHASIAVQFRPSAPIGGSLVASLIPGGRPRLGAARLTEDLALTDEELDQGGVVLPPPGAVAVPGGSGAPEVLLVLAKTRLVVDGTEVGVLRVRPPDPRPALRDWGPVDALLVDFNLVTVD